MLVMIECKRACSLCLPMQLRVLICVCCRYAGDSQFQVSVTGIPAGIKDVQVVSVGIV